MVVKYEENSFHPKRFDPFVDSRNNTLDDMNPTKTISKIEEKEDKHILENQIGSNQLHETSKKYCHHVL